MAAAPVVSRGDLESLFVVVAAGVVAVLLSDLVRRPRIASIVVEILLGIVIGPYVLGLASPTGLVKILAQFGLSYLLFLAGYEVELQRIRGRPLGLAGLGWLTSLALGLSIAVVLRASGLVVSALFVGLALATTALGPLLPILHDEGVTETPFGAFVLAAGTLGEFGPIVAVTLVLGARRPYVSTALLCAFGLAVVATAILATRWHPSKLARLVRDTMQTSAQFAVRLSLLLLVGLVLLADILGLDVLLGAFAAGMIVRLASGGEEVESIQTRLTTIGYGAFIPIFFVATGLNFDVRALLRDPRTIVAIPALLAAFLLVRGLPVLYYRRVLERVERGALAFFSATGLSMIVVITTIAVQAGEMRQRTAVALVAAGMISIFAYPIAALALLRRKAGPS